MKIIGLYCEMIGVYPKNTDSLARVSIVDEKSIILYDKYVRQNRRVYCYRTKITGIVKEDLYNGKKFKNARREVINILKNSILVGHSIHHDLNILQITPDILYDINCQVRDIAVYGYFRKINSNQTPSLRTLALKFLNMNIQQNFHSSVEDAHAAVMLYMKVQKMWESEIQWHKTWNLFYEESEEESDEYDENIESDGHGEYLYSDEYDDNDDFYEDYRHFLYC